MRILGISPGDLFVIVAIVAALVFLLIQIGKSGKNEKSLPQSEEE